MRAFILAAVLLWTAVAVAAERQVSPAQRPAPAPTPTVPTQQPGGNVKQSGISYAPVQLGCSFSPISGAGMTLMEFFAKNGSDKTIPAGMKIKYTVRGSMISISGQAPNYKSTSTPFESPGELLLASPLAPGSSVKFKSEKASAAVGYSNCTAFAAP